MARVRIVTDSTAIFEDARIVDDYDITVVPLNVRFGDQVYRDKIDITAEETSRRLRHTLTRPKITSPPVSVFEEVYEKLNKKTDQICVMVNSNQCTRTYSNAQTARRSLLGRCEIAVFDSLTTSVSLGFLVEKVAEVAAMGASLHEVVRVARSTIPRVYTVYYVDQLDYIRKAGLIGETQAILGTMLGIKPLLTIEDGALITMEKARTHSQAIDKVIEFVTEFTHIEKLSIVQGTLHTTNYTRMLQDRLALELSKLQCPVLLYDPLIATLIGPRHSDLLRDGLHVISTVCCVAA